MLFIPHPVLEYVNAFVIDKYQPLLLGLCLLHKTRENGVRQLKATETSWSE